MVNYILQQFLTIFSQPVVDALAVSRFYSVALPTDEICNIVHVADIEDHAVGYNPKPKSLFKSYVGKVETCRQVQDADGKFCLKVSNLVQKF